MKKLIAIALFVLLAAPAFAADDYIVVNRSKQAGNQLVSLAERIREIRELVDKLSDISGHQIDGADYSTFETQFGLPASSGANVATLIALINNIFNTNTTVAGADRLSQLDEFCARLSVQ